MALAAFFDFSVYVFLKAARAERDAMIKFYSRTDLGSFADYDAGPVINKKMRSNFCARMNIDPGAAVCPFGHDARYQWHLVVQQVRHSVNGDRFQGRISKNDFLVAFRRRITFIGRVNVRPKYASHRWQFSEKFR